MPKSFLLLVMAAGCGLVAMLGLRQLVSKEKEGSDKAIRVLVAKTNIKPYIPLTDDLVEFQERPADQVPIGAVQTITQYDRRALRQAAVKGEVILTSKLGEKGDYAASSEIPSGYRLFTVPITATTSHSGQIRPHDRVDIFVTYSSKENKNNLQTQMKTKMILDYIEVFAMGADRYSDTAADDQILAKNASLLVTPQQAAILMMAETKGTLSLTLRPKDDNTTANIDPLSEKDFDALGTDYSLRDEYEEKLTTLEKDLTTKHQQELAELDQKTAEQFQQTMADLKQKYVDEQKRRDQMHAETLAGLEAKNIELQTLLQQAIAESSDKSALANRLNELKNQNGKLQNLLADARKRAENAKPIEVEAVEIIPEKWIIRVLSGKVESVREFDVNSEDPDKENESKDEDPKDSKPVEEQTKNKNSARLNTQLSTSGR